MFNFKFIIQLGQSAYNRKHPLRLTQEDVALTQVSRGTHLHKTGQPNLNPDRRTIEIDENDHWPGFYVSEHKEVAHGYGPDNGNIIDKKIHYKMNNFRAASGIPTLEIKKKSFGSSDYTSDQKAEAVIDFIRENGVGNIKNMEPNMMSEFNFNKLSKNVQGTFNREENIRLLPGLDYHKLAVKVPNNDQGRTELILNKNTVGNIIRNGKTTDEAMDLNTFRIL